VTARMIVVLLMLILTGCQAYASITCHGA